MSPVNSAVITVCSRRKRLVVGVVIQFAAAWLMPSGPARMLAGTQVPSSGRKVKKPGRITGKNCEPGCGVVLPVFTRQVGWPLAPVTTSMAANSRSKRTELLSVTVLSVRP